MPRISLKRGLSIAIALALTYLLGLKSCLVQNKGLIGKREWQNPSYHEAEVSKKEGVLVRGTELQNDKSWLRQMDEKHRARIDTLRKVCVDHYNISLNDISSLAATPGRLRPLIVNDEFKFIYSIVYKVGSTNWERVLVEDLGGFKNVPNQKLYSHKALHWMPRYNSTEIQQRLTEYLAFIFVRNPLARILSAFRDKFVNHHNNFFSKLGSNIVQNYREEFNSHLSTDNVTLTEFIRYLVDSPSNRLNPHWKPIFHQNLPCEIKYDIIGKLEDSSEDIPYVLKRLQIDHLVSYRQGQKKNSPEKSLLAQYFSEVPNDLLQKLYSIYEPDFVLFGYDIPSSHSDQ